MRIKASAVLAAGAFALLPAISSSASAQVPSLPIPGGLPDAPAVHGELSVGAPLDLLVLGDVPGTQAGEPGSLVVSLAGQTLRLPPVGGGAGGLPGLPDLPGVGALPTDPGAVTALVEDLLGGGLPGGGGGLPSLPALPTELTGLAGALPVDLPVGIPSLPTDLGALSGALDPVLNGGLPGLPTDQLDLLTSLPGALGGAGGLPNPADLLASTPLAPVGGLVGTVTGALPLP